MAIRALLLDLNGVLYEDSTPLPGALRAVQEARAAGLLLRFVTNTATRHPDTLLADLRRMGFQLAPEELFTAPLAARSRLLRRGWCPLTLVHPAIEPLFRDLGGIPCPSPVPPPSDDRDPGGGCPLPEVDCVVLGDARERLNYANLNLVFRLVQSGKPLLGIGLNRCFREAGESMLDAGPFIRAIEWATRTEAEIVGKPSRSFYEELIATTGEPPHQCLMVGDDAEADVIGALQVGMAAALVMTGKARAEDRGLLPPQAGVLDSLEDWHSLVQRSGSSVQR